MTKRFAILRVCAAVGLGLGVTAVRDAAAWPSKPRAGQGSGAQALAQTPPTQPPAPTPPPQQGTRIEVLVLEGGSGPGGIAAGLESLPQLRRPPFSSYPQITVVSRATHPLSNQSTNVALPGGGAAEITLSNRTPNAGRASINVQISTNGRAHNVQFAATVNAPFFTVVSSANNRALILGFIVR